MSTTTLGYRLSAATGIHRGDRAYQQDQVQIIPHARVPGCALGVLADGMGGKSGGRKAADQVILTAQQLFDPGKLHQVRIIHRHVLAGLGSPGGGGPVFHRRLDHALLVGRVHLVCPQTSDLTMGPRP